MAVSIKIVRAVNIVLYRFRLKAKVAEEDNGYVEDGHATNGMKASVGIVDSSVLKDEGKQDEDSEIEEKSSEVKPIIPSPGTDYGSTLKDTDKEETSTKMEPILATPLLKDKSTQNDSVKNEETGSKVKSIILATPILKDAGKQNFSGNEGTGSNLLKKDLSRQNDSVSDESGSQSKSNLAAPIIAGSSMLGGEGVPETEENSLSGKPIELENLGIVNSNSNNNTSKSEDKEMKLAGKPIASADSSMTNDDTRTQEDSEDNIKGVSLATLGIAGGSELKETDGKASHSNSKKSLAALDHACRCQTEMTSEPSKMVKFYPILAICNSVAIAIQYVFNALASSGPDGTIFLNKTGDLSDKYFTEITPAGWTFSIWGFIYAWQVTWVIYSLVNICRKGATGRPAYADPQFLPNSLFLISIVIAALNIGWLISFDREEIELSAAALIAYSLMQYALMFVVYRSLDRASPKLAQQSRSVDIWLTRGTVLNGVAMQATWVTIATLLNTQMVLIYSGDQLVCVEDAATIVLSVLTVIIGVFAVSDLFFLDRYSRYTITPYIVVVLGLSGSISKNWNSEKRNSIFTAVLLAVSSLLLGTKLVVTIYRHFTKARYTTMNCECKNEMKSKDTDKFEP